MVKNIVFLFKERGSNDRDVVKYIDINDLHTHHICCDGKFNVVGACFSMSLGGAYCNVPYEDIITILTEKQYNRLCNPATDDDFSDIIARLDGKENAALFEEVKKAEKEYIYDEFGLDEDDMEEIFDEYDLLYRDRAIIGCVYDNAEDLGYNEVSELGYLNNGNNFISRYIDYESLGEDLAADCDSYITLSDGRIVCVNY